MKKILLSAIIAILSGSILKAQVPVLNLEAAYHFSGNANDMSGHGLNGTNNAAVLSTDRFGNPNSAYDFSTGGYIDCNNVLNSVIAGAGKQITISFWIKPAMANNSNVILAKHADAACTANDREFFIRSLNNIINVEYYGTTSGTNGRFVCGSTLLTDYTHWYHVVVTYDGTVNTSNGLDRVKIYVDNNPETTTLTCRTQSGTFPFDIVTSAAHFGIGNYLNNAGTPCSAATYYKGKIDDIRIYSRVLSSTEVTQLFNEVNTAGISSLFNNVEIDVYPNPASDHLSVELKGLMSKSEIQVMDVLGKVIYSETVNGAENTVTQIKTANFAKGLYFIRILSENEVVANKKIVIQ
ncbi:MAG: C-terminal target protein [Bacteroidetes bacterium]|nr:C-terminal target protein [Bacteroidota bacterium]